MKDATTGNQVKFLLDGVNFFGELKRHLDRVKDSPPSPDTYVRLAFWEAKPNCVIDFSGKPLDVKSAPNLTSMLKGVADAGHNVQFICWTPDKLARAIMKVAKATLAGEILRKGVTYQSQKVVEGADKKKFRGRVQVYTEEYKGWFFGTSNHQKIAIFSVKGELTVIVGGFNLMSGYYATVNHTYAEEGDDDDYKGCWHWHDTAVELKGPATIAVEREWLRRWRKRSIVKTSPVQARLDMQPKARDGSAVEILTTNSERLSRETDIRKALCERIASAEYYVFLENYVLSDPGLVSALADRMRANKKLVVLFVTGKKPDMYSFLNRISLLKLTVAAGGAGILEIRRGKTSVRKSFNDYFREGKILEGNFSNPDLIDQTALLANPFMAKDAFQFKAPEDTKPTKVALPDIRDALSDRVFYCYPVHPFLPEGKESLYVHSKLVLVDDDTAFIGSANLSYRSMVYDGEMCACIHGDAAKRIRIDLFKHYNLDFTDRAAIRDTLPRTLLSRRTPPSDAPHLEVFRLGEFSNEIPTIVKGNHTWH